MAPKTLLVFCDGTGMDGSLAPPKKQLGVVSEAAALNQELGEDTPGGGTGTIQYATNVLRLSRSVKSLDANGNRQIVFYQSGVGSEANFTGDPVTGTTAMQALGTAVASKIRDAYVFLGQNFEEGDEICIFGFSRGAYTARKLSGLIDRIGLLTCHDLGYFFETWLELIHKKTPDPLPGTRYLNIKCVGVWDTVGSVYNEIDALNIVDTGLPKTVKVALHAISVQENRKKFLPTLWTIPQGGLQPDQTLKQVWFAGAHSDVGGGYKRHELADISLYWMAGEIKSLINIDLDFLRSYAQVEPDPWGTSQPHNSYEETSPLLRPVVGHKTRLESSDIVQQSVFHDSIKYSPQKLFSPDYMITMSIIATSFGSGFAPQYPALNDFEQYCKDNWGRGLLTHRDGIESPDVLIRPTARWVRRQTGPIPSDTVVGGAYWFGETVYVARAPYHGGLYPGLLSESDFGCITPDGKVINISEANLGCEILTGYQTRWVSVSGNFSLSKLGGAVPVPLVINLAGTGLGIHAPAQGGWETDGEDLFIAQFVSGEKYGSNAWCGKVKENDLARFVFGDSEITVDSYNVLVTSPL